MSCRMERANGSCVPLRTFVARKYESALCFLGLAPRNDYLKLCHNGKHTAEETGRVLLRGAGPRGPLDPFISFSRYFLCKRSQTERRKAYYASEKLVQVRLEDDDEEHGDAAACRPLNKGSACLRDVTRRRFGRNDRVIESRLPGPAGSAEKFRTEAIPRGHRDEARTPLHAGTYRRTTCIIESAVSQRAPAELNGRELLALSSESSKVRNGDDQIDGYAKALRRRRRRRQRRRERIRATCKKLVREGRTGEGNTPQ